MKFKGKRCWRELAHKDHAGDSISVSVTHGDGSRVYISTDGPVSLSFRDASKLIRKIEKELSR